MQSQEKKLQLMDFFGDGRLHKHMLSKSQCTCELQWGKEDREKNACKALGNSIVPEVSLSIKVNHRDETKLLNK